MNKSAILSQDWLHRFQLLRVWDTEKPKVAFIGLNPSTADANNDDPTIRRCIRFAKDWGYGGIIMVNLFSFRATSPADMKAHHEPNREENVNFILSAAHDARVVICAWGANGDYLKQNEWIKKLLRDRDIPMGCLGKTKDGHPRHPLYIKADKLPEIFE